MSLNDDIRDLQLRHTIGIQRLSTSTVRKILKLLDEVDMDIVRKLSLRSATLEGTLTSQRLNYLLTAVRETLRDGYTKLGQDLRQDLRDLAKYEVEFQQRLITNTTPIKLDVTMPTAPMLNTLVSNTLLNGAVLNDLVKDLSRKKLQAVSNAVRLGMVQGETTNQIIRRVRGTQALGFKDGVLNLPRQSAEKLVRTATNHIATQARDLLYQENDDLVKGWQWVATLDTRTCLECASKDGEVYEVGEKGEKPPLHINCRCTTTPVLKSWRELGIDAEEMPESTRASMDGQVSATETYSKWLKRQPAKMQDEALGKTRGKLFRDGKLPVDRFLDIRGNQLTLDQLRVREARAFTRAGV